MDDDVFFKNAIQLNFPGAKKEKNTSTYIFNDKKLIIKYSQLYENNVHYWFGITESDKNRIEINVIDSVNLLCIGKGFISLDHNTMKSLLPKLNFTQKRNNLYHLHIYYYNNSNIVLTLKNGQKVNLEDKITLLN